MSEEFLAFPLPGGRWSRRDRMRVSIVGAVVIDGRTQRSAPTRAIVTCHPIDNGCTSVVPLIRHVLGPCHLPPCVGKANIDSNLYF